MADWVEYRPQLLRAYFASSSPIAPPESAFHKEFLAFLSRCEAKVVSASNASVKKKLDQHPLTAFGAAVAEGVDGCGGGAAVPCNSNGVPEGPYCKYFASNIQLTDKAVDRFQLMRNVPAEAVRQFEHIIALYQRFRNAKNFKKLKKLKQSQLSLPIYQSREEILTKLAENQIVVIAGDTGCGKSTQLPQYLLNAGYVEKPALAQRVACEMLKQFDSHIAYQTRFDKTKTSATRMLFLTEGVLLRQMVDDPGLQRYDVLILDEVHERNISGDLLVALLRSACQRRTDLKLILMSATINIELFQHFFPEAPVISVPGRLYPIEQRYMPPLIRELDPTAKKAVRIDPGPYVNILQLIDKKYPSTERGDVLVFLNGISEISIVADACKEFAEFTKRWIVLILHSTLSVEEQQKVFDLAPMGVRKCILSTNIAETSVTIDEIRFVIDSGKENLMRYDPSIRTHRLTESWIAKASADQRKGRAGRTGPGVCFRLYSEEEFTKMEDFTLPEIKRVALDSLVIQILDMNLHIDVRDFPFLERPDMRPLNETLEALKAQGVVDSRNEKTLTPLGIILAKLPVDVAISKMLIYACVLNQLDIALTIAASLSVQSPFTNRSFRDADCIQGRQHLLSDMGCPFTLIRVYREWLRVRHEGVEDTRRWTRRLGIEEARLYEITKLRRQFREILEQNELVPRREEREWAALSSRERRLLVGEKRKLFELKKRAGHEGKRTKVLREGQHFDTIMERNREEESHLLANAQEQIQHLEFSLVTGGKGMERELGSHRLDDNIATELKLVLAAGLYPQYGVLDPTNNFREGHDQFAHTPSKPFVVLHPNSALGQRPDVLRLDDLDSEAHSAQHQLIYFGLLLETTKPYLCNSCRIPATFLLVIARNITCVSPCVLCCDGFVEFHFLKARHCDHSLEFACRVRSLFLQSVEHKLRSDDYGDCRELERLIIKFARLQHPFSIRRRIDPPKSMEYGVFTADGMQHPLSASLVVSSADGFDGAGDEEDAELDAQLDKRRAEEEQQQQQQKGREYFCDVCACTLWFADNVQAIKHKKGHQQQQQ
uniref:ATP-dependent RNA helicase DHX34 n=1 Tax=Globodera rostochiensis TaxID=31243 RepID=A0A914H4K2_GLORO